MSSRKEATNTLSVVIGNHSKFTARPTDRARIRKFFMEVLACDITRRSNEIDFFRLGDNFFFAAIYAEQALPEKDARKSIWLELKSNDPEALSRRIREFGVIEVESWEKNRLYFQAPDGQVFRIAGVNEDLSRFER